MDEPKEWNNGRNWIKVKILIIRTMDEHKKFD
jgi:hypothetical protein